VRIVVVEEDVATVRPQERDFLKTAEEEGLVDFYSLAKALCSRTTLPAGAARVVRYGGDRLRTVAAHC
jgi:hypothetical protein